MADEWTSGRLGDCIRLQSGGTPSKSRPEFWGGTVPWVSAKDMKSFWIEDSEDHLSELGVSQATRIVDAGTTLMLVRGMTLHNDVPICRVRRRSAFNQDVKAVVPASETDAAFVPYLLLGNKQRLLSSVDSAGHGTGRLITDTLLDLAIRIAPRKQQQAIACILGALDDKIELNRAMNRTLEGMAQALFKSWFVDFDPVRAKAAVRRDHPRWTNEQVSRAACPNLAPEIAALFPDAFQDSELGDIPKGWRDIGLNETGTFLNGLALQKYPATGGDSLPVIKIAQLRKGNTEGADTATAKIEPSYIVEDGDVLFSWSGSLECMLWAGGRGALNQHLFKVTSDKFSRWFYYLWILYHLPAFRHIAAGKATTMGHIQRHHLADAKVVVASPDLLARADLAIGAMIDAAVLKSLESRSLAAIRDGLLPRLISGELRVPDAERIAGRCL